MESAGWILDTTIKEEKAEEKLKSLISQVKIKDEKDVKLNTPEYGIKEDPFTGKIQVLEGLMPGVTIEDEKFDKYSTTSEYEMDEESYLERQCDLEVSSITSLATRTNADYCREYRRRRKAYLLQTGMLQRKIPKKNAECCRDYRKRRQSKLDKVAEAHCKREYRQKNKTLQSC